MDQENRNEALKQEDEVGNPVRIIKRDRSRSSLSILQSAFHDLSSNVIPVIEDENDSGVEQEIDVPTKDERTLKNLDHDLHKRQNDQTDRHLGNYIQSMRRVVFLLLTDPQSSLFSAIFFIILITMIALSNLLMMMQTTTKFTFTPDTCSYCTNLTHNNDTFCVCPPQPLHSLIRLQDYGIIFFTAEWALRVLCFVPKSTSGKQTYRSQWGNYFKQWLSFLVQPSMIIDALAIFPYYLERFGEFKGLLALRLLRLFRVFHLLRLGKYNVTFKSLLNVMRKSFLGLNILCVVLFFGAAFFGSMIYYFEKGRWQYTTYTDPPSYRYMRLGADGITEEPSPFSSIPESFWWFIVTATTVGYGDVYPTSAPGKIVATFAMLTGLLVVAFPVSIFSDLWHQELNNNRDSRKAVTTLSGFEARRQSILYMTKRSSLPNPRRKHSRRKSLRKSNYSKQLKSESSKMLHNNIDSISSISSIGDNADNSLTYNNPSPSNLLEQADLDFLHYHLSSIDNSQTEIRKMLSSYCDNSVARKSND